jgi:hypothetical protein
MSETDEVDLGKRVDLVPDFLPLLSEEGWLRGSIK